MAGPARNKSRPLLLLAAWIILAGCGNNGERTTFRFQTMGTEARCDLQLSGELSAAAAQALVAAVYDSVNSVFSTWRTDSELSRLNRAPADSSVTLSPWLKECLTVAERLRRLSGGAFDPTAEPLMRLWGFYRREGRFPAQAELDSAMTLLGRWRFAGPEAMTKTNAGTHFDLGGIAKGFAVDLAVRSLQEAGVTDGLIDLGGNLYCLGGAPGCSEWRIGLRDPLDPNRFFASVAVTGLAIATSGSYERFVTIEGRRYGHIMNPATGRPAEGVLSATVLSGSALLADGLSTTLFVLGPENGAKLLTDLDEPVEAVLVIPGQGAEKARVLVTPGLRGRVTIAPDYAEAYELVLWQ